MIKYSNLNKTPLEYFYYELGVLNDKLEYINRLPQIYNSVNVIHQPEILYNKIWIDNI